MTEEKTKEQEQMDKIVNDIAKNINDLSKVIGKLLNGKLGRNAILILLAHSTSMKQWQVNEVLIAIEGMGKKYTKK